MIYFDRNAASKAGPEVNWGGPTRDAVTASDWLSNSRAPNCDRYGRQYHFSELTINNHYFLSCLSRKLYLLLKRALAEKRLSQQQQSKPDLGIGGNKNIDHPTPPRPSKLKKVTKTTTTATKTKQEQQHNKNPIIVLYLVTRCSFRIKFPLPWWWVPWHFLWFRILRRESKPPMVRDVKWNRSKRYEEKAWALGYNLFNIYARGWKL